MKKDKAGGPGLGGLLVRTRATLKSIGERFSSPPKSSRNLKFGTRRLPENASEYELLELCGQGASSMVVRGVCKKTGEEVAIKCVELDSLQLDLEMFVRETAVMRSMKHTHLLPLYATSVEAHYLWIITPFVSGGTLENILHHAFQQGFYEKVIATISKMVLEALDYLHKHGIVHRDIKTSNILVRNDGHVYLGDLGIAAQVVQQDVDNPGKMLRLERHTFAGTLQYISPEIVEGIGYDERVDIWSYGITLLECITGARPFGKMPMQQALMSIMNDDPPEPPASCSDALSDFVQRCLCKDPAQRWTAEQLLNHRFLKLAMDKEYLAQQLVSQLPPEDVRTEVFVKQAMIANKGANSPSADTLYADGLRRLQCLQPSSDTSPDPTFTTSSSGGPTSPNGVLGELEVDRTVSSWNFLTGLASFSSGRKKSKQSTTGKMPSIGSRGSLASADGAGSHGVSPGASPPSTPLPPQLPTIPSVETPSTANSMPSIPSTGSTQRAPSSAAHTTASISHHNSLSSAYTMSSTGSLPGAPPHGGTPPKTRRHEAAGKSIKWAAGVQSRNGRMTTERRMTAASSVGGGGGRQDS